MKLRRIILLLLFILAILILLPKPLAQEPVQRFIGFKVVDYDPTTQMFILKPSKRILVGAVYQMGEEGSFPTLLGRIGKKVKCQAFDVNIGYWVDRENVRRTLYALALMCGEDVLYLNSIINMTATEWKIMMLDDLKRARRNR